MYVIVIHRQLPANLVQGLAESRAYHKAYAETRYLALALFDLMVHAG